MLTAGPRDQFPKWRRSRERLSVCSVLRCPDLWLQCSVSFVHGLEKTHHASFLNIYNVRVCCGWRTPPTVHSDRFQLFQDSGQIAVTVWQIPDAVDTVVCALDDGRKYHPKHVGQFPDINKLCNVTSCWIYEYIGILLGVHYILHISRIRINLN